MSLPYLIGDRHDYGIGCNFLHDGGNMRIVRILALVALLSLVLINKSQAASPVTISASKVGGLYTTTPVATAVSLVATAFRGPVGQIISAVSIGTQLLQLAMSDSTSHPLMVLPGRNVAPPTPSGWTDANTPSATASITYSNGTNNYGSAGAACTALQTDTLDWSPAYLNGVQCLVQVTPYGTAHGYGATGTVGSLGSISSICPTGYTASSGVCTLSNASTATWPLDGNVDYQPNSTSNGFVKPAREPETLAGYAPGSAPTTLTRTGTDVAGNPVSETVSANSAGGIDYQRDTQTLDDYGRDTVQRDKLSTDVNGLVISATTAQFFNSTLGSVNTSNLVGASSGSTDLSPVTNAINNLDTDMKNQDAGSCSCGITFPDVSAPTFTETNTQFKSDFNALPWLVTIKAVAVTDSGVCPTLSLAMGMLGTHSTNIHCDIIEANRGIINTVSVAGFALMGVFIIMRA